MRTMTGLYLNKYSIHNLYINRMKTIKNRNKKVKKLKGGSITNDEPFSKIIKLNHMQIITE